MVVKLPPGACQGGVGYTSTHGQQVRIKTMSKHDSTSESQTSTPTSWYKDALIYELHVRAFYDSNSDGIGDFPGLTQKLGYLQDLGVTEIGRFLIEHGFTHTPPVAGALAYKPQRGEPISLAIVQSYVPNQGELWDIFQAALRSYF